VNNVFVVIVLVLICFGDREEILLFIIIITMCPRVPDLRCGNGAKATWWMSLFWFSFFCIHSLWQSWKKQHIYREATSKYTPNFETSKFLTRQKHALDYACMTKVWPSCASNVWNFMQIQQQQFKALQQHDCYLTFFKRCMLVIFFEITGMHEANTRDSGVH